MAGGYQPGYFESSDPRNKNAIWFLCRSNEKLYLAKSGLTDGAAMRVAGIAAYYTESFEKMVEVVNNISRITHSFAEARIAAILVAIRFHDIFNGIDNSPADLIIKLQKACAIIGLEEDSSFFIKKCKLAAKIATLNSNPEHCLIELLQKIGMNKLSWSTPISATFWSYHEDVNFEYYLSSPQQRYRVTSGGALVEAREIRLRDKHDSLKVYDYTSTIAEVHAEDREHIRGLFDKEGLLISEERIDQAFPSRLDIDTFFSISFSLLAAKNGLGNLNAEASRISQFVFKDNINLISRQLVERH
jgi:hypothetical protein